MSGDHRLVCPLEDGLGCVRQKTNPLCIYLNGECLQNERTTVEHD
jgi:hypothetical protein